VNTDQGWWFEPCRGDLLFEPEQNVVASSLPVSVEEAEIVVEA
jgi:hypothetical protein